jgi:surfeit locus 1 family protein
LRVGAEDWVLPSGRDAGRVDVAELPGDQDADKQQDGESDAKRQRARHVAGLGPSVAAILQHEVKGRPETPDDGNECEDDEIHHGVHYPVSRALDPARFWLLLFAAVAGVSVTLALGFWQLSRGAEKQAMQALVDGRRELAALDARALANAVADSDIVYRHASLRGTWLAEHTVFLDNRPMNGMPGFFVLTPLRLEGSDAAVVVQRGWVQRSFVDRAQVPPVPTPAGPVHVSGRIAPPPSKLYEFEGMSGGVIRQNLDLAAFSHEIGLPLATVSLQQLGPAGDGLVRDWPRINTGVDKHYGYAFQWFALSGLIAFLYGWFQIVRRFVVPD